MDVFRGRSGWTERALSGLAAFAAFVAAFAGGVSAAQASRVLEKRVRAGDLVVVSRWKDPEAEDALDYAPRVSVLLGGREVAGVEFPDNVGMPKVFVVEMDPSNSRPEVVAESYSGGAHCCEEIVVFSAPPNGGGGAWRKVELGAFDGAERIPRDLDGDGLAEVLVRDDAFYYAYGCYGCSYAPPVILSVRDGRKVELTRRPSFRPVLREEEKRILRRMRESREENGGRVENGLLAGYVALKLLLGEGAEGWNEMLKWHVREKQEFCPVPGRDGDCAVRPLMISFPLSLAIALRGRYIPDPAFSTSGN